MPAQRQFRFECPDGDIIYTVQTSLRAKHVRLRVSPREGLVVVVPQGFDRSQVAGIVAKRLSWIRKAFGKMPVVRSPEGLLLQTLSLRSIGEEWCVFFEVSRKPECCFVEKPGRILEIHSLPGGLNTQLDLLREWVKRKAVTELLKKLDEVSKQYGFLYDKGAVRCQKTRWGSCSTKRTISLNMKLLFLPPGLVEYIMLHELCHTVYMNHSQRFWALVEQKMPDYIVYDRAMREASRYIPQFLQW
ncbi:SprT family zinc-dependent metalloprotease [Prosthecochloris sp.]|uniref:M48 family metallopeptidase n=1 Tax=Prosthecochloris sp. TaxID=290513 RepID=UPI00257A9696|nr:SprT family zinc-dependent metalloprotease [Prosthecochloris sp.]